MVSVRNSNLELKLETLIRVLNQRCWCSQTWEHLAVVGQSHPSGLVQKRVHIQSFWVRLDESFCLNQTDQAASGSYLQERFNRIIEIDQLLFIRIGGGKEWILPDIITIQRPTRRHLCNARSSLLSRSNAPGLRFVYQNLQYRTIECYFSIYKQRSIVSNNLFAKFLESKIRNLFLQQLQTTRFKRALNEVSNFKFVAMTLPKSPLWIGEFSNVRMQSFAYFSKSVFHDYTIHTINFIELNEKIKFFI